MLNKQPAEKPVAVSVFNELDVHSVFLTIQGEGPFAGQRAVFVRLAGCNLQCPKCDTDYTSARARRSPESLVRQITQIQEPPNLVVITGGEPFRQRIGTFVRLLLEAGHRVQVETNGTLPPDPDFPVDGGVTIVCSPKTGSLNKAIAPHIAALKYVVSARDTAPEDGLPYTALGHPAKPRLARPPVGFTGIVYVQPADEQSPETNSMNLAEAINSVMEHDYVLCLQTHKIIGME